MALLDTQVAVLANQALNFLVSGRSPRRMGNSHPNLVPYQVFQACRRAADRRHRQRPAVLGFLPQIGLPELAEDPRYASNADRVRNREPFIATLRPRSRAGIAPSCSPRSKRRTFPRDRSTKSAKPSPTRK